MSDEKVIINFIEKIYQQYCRNVNLWNKNELSNYNLRSKQVKHIMNDVNKIEFSKEEDIFDFEFINLLKLYNSHLGVFTLTLEFGLDADKFEYGQRIKADNSIFSKLATYRTTEKHQYGRLALNKCINDLFGLRIIVNNEKIEYNIIEEYCNEHSPKLRFINSTKDGYKAYHVYFKIDNYNFPWELQIWEKRYEKSNRISHAKHKQEYIKWESIIKKIQEVE